MALPGIIPPRTAERVENVQPGRDHVKLRDFRGSAGASGIHAFRMKPMGAGFDLVDHEEFLWGCLVTDLDFSAAGGAYVSDWAVGPRLDGIGDRQSREYLLESIVHPNAKIAAGFDTVMLKTRDQGTISGVLKKEDAVTIEVLAANGKTVKVPTDEVISRERGLSATPEGFAKILRRRDLRDLVEFLAGLHATPKKK